MEKLYLIIGLFWLTGCSDFLQEYSQDLAYVQSYEDLDELLLGNAYFERYTGRSWQFAGSAGDFYYPWIHLSGDEVQQIINNSWMLNGAGWVTYGYYTWQYRVYNDPDGKQTWDESSDFHKLYAHINACNMILDEAKAFENSIDENVQENVSRIKGECYFLRGCYYFLLTNFYEKPYEATTATTDLSVPIKLSNYVEDVFFQRNSVAEVYAQVEADLLEAERILKDIPKKSIYRADVQAVRLMLSRMYLYMCNYEKAMQYASMVVDNGPELADLNTFTGYEFLTPDLSELIFSTGSSSLVENIAFVDEGSYSGNDYQISEELYQSYDPQRSHDLRLKYYVVDTAGCLCYRKLQGGYYEETDLSDVFLLRTSEAYLNLAEAAACTGDEVTARATINTLRRNRIARAYYNSLEIEHLRGEDLVNFIRNERRRELCLEGHRWFDLRRYRVATAYPQEITLEHIHTNMVYDYAVSNYVISWIRKFVLTSDDPAWVLPLPEEEVDKNTGMINNPRNERSYENIN